MSAPLFIAAPTNGSGTAAILGASLAAYSGATPMVDLTTIGGEPVLIEDISWCAEKFSTTAGMLLLAVVDNGGNRRLVGAYAIAAGSATLIASDRIKLDLTLAAGFKLVAAHNVQDAGAAYTNLDIVPIGGVVR